MSVDLLRLVEDDLGPPARRAGRWHLWRCPFHDDRHPSLAVTNGNDRYGPGWRCFAASCGKHGGPLAWLMEYRGLSRQEAQAFLNRENPFGATRASALPPVDARPHTPPGPLWQQRAWELVRWAQSNLWGTPGMGTVVSWPTTDPETGQKVQERLSPFEWLTMRGLTAQTIEFWKLGYIPPHPSGRPYWLDKAERWGLEGKPVYIPQGILIPCILENRIWYLKVRQPGPKGRRYTQIRRPAGHTHPALYLGQTLEFFPVAVFTEGELDALLLWQEVEDLAGVATLGSANATLHVPTWGVYLLHLKTLFLAYDNDQAGKAAWEKWDWLRARPLPPPRLRPQDKDLTDFHRSGGNVRAWLQQALEGRSEAPEGALRAEMTL